jgi:hypothetical protein
MVDNDYVSKRDAGFLEAVGFGKQENEWITQYDSFPVRDGFLCDWMIVGRDPPTNPYCGKHRSYLKCAETFLHDSIGGRDFYHNRITNCHSYRCHTCWKYGWCVHRALAIDSRFLTAEKVLGLPITAVEHISASMPKELYGYSPQDMAKACFRALIRRGVLGGANIIHPFRKDLKRRDLYKSFHYHCLCYIKGGYTCRSCTKNVNGVCLDLSCDGFEAVTRRCYDDDGWIVNLARNEKGFVEERKSVFGTAWYQCEHSGFKVGVKNFHIVEWWGNVAKRKFHTVMRSDEPRCAVCKSEMKQSFLPTGVKVVANRGERGFLKNFTLPHVDDEEVMRFD